MLECGSVFTIQIYCLLLQVLDIEVLRGNVLILESAPSAYLCNERYPATIEDIVNTSIHILTEDVPLACITIRSLGHLLSDVNFFDISDCSQQKSSLGYPYVLISIL